MHLSLLLFIFIFWTLPSWLGMRVFFGIYCLFTVTTGCLPFLCNHVEVCSCLCVCLYWFKGYGNLTKAMATEDASNSR
ncbi:MAG: hypothetical protein EXX96DRAFT_561663 [Benjaminiella poitrasii]|nr:MAG: hypothetical protein EXX96DRAFT_579029 [Benjaminiella poitrasii]KAI9480251.1 MAG: hypothetical protein EXX96DRAFT_561663 [Benjaminiella poitrasii]